MQHLLFCAAAMGMAVNLLAHCPNADLSDHPGEWQARTGYRGAAQYKAPPGSYNKVGAEAT